MNTVTLNNGKTYRLVKNFNLVEVKTVRVHAETGLPVWMRVNGVKVIAEVMAALEPKTAPAVEASSFDRNNHTVAVEGEVFTRVFSVSGKVSYLRHHMNGTTERVNGWALICDKIDAAIIEDAHAEALKADYLRTFNNPVANMMIAEYGALVSNFYMVNVQGLTHVHAAEAMARIMDEAREYDAVTIQLRMTLRELFENATPFVREVIISDCHDKAIQIEDAARGNVYEFKAADELKIGDVLALAVGDSTVEDIEPDTDNTVRIKVNGRWREAYNHTVIRVRL